MNSTRRIICICSGNICRSPMAVALLRHKLTHRQVPAVVISAGTLGIQGRRASDFARGAIAELGDKAMKEVIDEHRSQGISPSMLRMADELIVMAPRHDQHVRRLAPDTADRIVQLWTYADDPTLDKIPDPVGHDAVVFRGCRDLIDNCLDQWLQQTFGPREVASD